jgi:hypothetical protein
MVSGFITWEEFGDEIGSLSAILSQGSNLTGVKHPPPTSAICFRHIFRHLMTHTKYFCEKNVTRDLEGGKKKSEIAIF